MICPHCGKGTSAGQARCTGCGRSVSAVGTSVLTPPPTPDELTFKTPVPNPDDMTRVPGPNDSFASAGPLAIGQKFGSRYLIVKMLGIGGMGAVYQAWDHELDMVVAIKVIRPEATTDPRELEGIERRFKQELLLARQVTHKNVVRIHDLGEIDGIKYITMSYIEGADLATVLQREGKLTAPVALALTREIASGLLAAHEAGVVHRDLKPANIMIEGEHAVIMDFGIARSSDAGQAPVTPANLPTMAGSIAQTVHGAVVGTLTYMAPEQATGGAVDQRADLYALGMIISDMLLGLYRRGISFNAMDDLHRRMAERPQSLRKSNPSIPDAFDQIIMRLLEPDPAARFKTTADLVAALDRLDDKGMPLPLIHRLTPRMVATAAVIMLALIGGMFYVTRQTAPPFVVQHDPVSVVIADFQNNTTQRALDHVIEPMMRRALEGAGFINAFDGARLRSAVGLAVAENFDETAARDFAAKQGLGVVVAGTVTQSGSGYNIAIKAVQASTGNVIATADRSVTGSEDLFTGATRLAATIRTALGDETKESAQIQALALVDGKTEREQLSARGEQALATGDYQQCVKEYGDLIAKFEADVIGRQHRAMCMAKVRDMDGAVDDMRYVVNLLPNVTRFRNDLALYADYDGQFSRADEEARALPSNLESASLVVAMAQIGQDRLADATGTYDKLRAMSPLGESIATAGIADIAITQGRFNDAVRTLEQGAAAELAARNSDRAAKKYVALAYAELSRGRNAAAIAAAEKALANSDSVRVRFLAARTLIEAGDAAKARRVIDALASDAHVESQAHAQILEGDLALKNGDAREAIKQLTAANAQLDTWIGRFDLGRAYFDAGAYVQADSEIDRCLKRRGEAISLFLDEDPNFGYFPAVYYYQGRIREELKNAGAVDSYKQYLSYRGDSKEDPLLDEVRRRSRG